LLIFSKLNHIIVMEENNKETPQTDNQLHDLITISTLEQSFYKDEESFNSHEEINNWGAW
jgi:hypothetical protein